MEHNGVFSQKRLLSGFQTSTSKALTEAIILFGVGAFAVFMHQALRMPMHLPGKQGLIWIALLVAGRCSSRLGLAGSITGVGAAAASLCFISRDPFTWLIYLAAGFASDFIFTGIPSSKVAVAVLAASFGIIHVLKPVIRALIGMLSGIIEPSLMGGIMYPVFTHFIFGAAGALIGIAIGKGIASARGAEKA